MEHTSWLSVLCLHILLGSGAGLLIAPPASAQFRTWTSENVTLDGKPGALAGTLVVPSGTGKVPLVIVIAGSGPTDRDGNTMGEPTGPNSLRQLAEALGSRGIAALRYDKRGVGASGAAAVAEQNLRFEMYVDDAANWVRKYSGDPRFSCVVIIGHSEGSLVGMLAAQKAPVAGFVSIAGPARRADMVIRDQLAAQLPPSMLAEVNTLLASLVDGKTVSNPPPALASLFRPSVQPYMISWFHYSGAQEIARLGIPILIAQGTHDLQVATSEADALVRAQPAAKLLKLAGMNHVLKNTPAGRAEQADAYSNPNLPIVPELVSGIATFVTAVAGAK